MVVSLLQSNGMQLTMDMLMKKVAHTIATSIACLKEKSKVLVICALHNRMLAEYIVLESYALKAYPYLWVFDEKLFLRYARSFSDEAIATLPEHVCSLIRNSDVIIWLSQFDDIGKLPANVEEAIISFWDSVDVEIRTKPCLSVNLLSPRCIEELGLNYEKHLRAFAKAVNVDYCRLRRVGHSLARSLCGVKLVHVYDEKGTDLAFDIDKRRVGIEVGTLEDCFSSGKECEVDVPSGEVYVAPIETSANGVLTVEEFRGYSIQNLILRFKEGKIIDFKAEKGYDVFRGLLDKAEGDKDRIAEFGIGINYGMSRTGYRIYDEKALGTAHIAIGNNVHLGGENKASIHWDFVLYKPSIEADNVLIMKKGMLQNVSERGQRK